MYHNYHKHDDFGNPWIPDSEAKPEYYCKRAVELGHDTVFTTNHGVTGSIFHWIPLCQEYNLKLRYGMEAYYVNDRFEKDRSNKHLILIAKNNNGYRQINRLMTQAHSTGFYYRPRIDRELLFSVDPKDIIVTTACVAGIWQDTELILALKQRFGDNFFLEVQDHILDIQKECNKTLLSLSKEAHIPIIHANDSHYIYAKDAEYRDIYQRGKKIDYSKSKNEESAHEQTMILDYPSEEEIYERYEQQGILTRDDVYAALQSTLVFDECEPITVINDDIKLPSVSDDPMNDLRKIIRREWIKERANVPKERWTEYTDAISYELDIVDQTNMANYFLIDYRVAKDGQEKYDGRLTNTGRGSAPSFYITKLLGLTDIDRIDAPITLFPTRFMSVERILGSRSLPDWIIITQSPYIVICIE